MRTCMFVRQMLVLRWDTSSRLHCSCVAENTGIVVERIHMQLGFVSITCRPVEQPPCFVFDRAHATAFELLRGSIVGSHKKQEHICTNTYVFGLESLTLCVCV